MTALIDQEGGGCATLTGAVYCMDAKLAKGHHSVGLTLPPTIARCYPTLAADA